MLDAARMVLKSPVWSPGQHLGTKVLVSQQNSRGAALNMVPYARVSKSIRG